MDKDIRFTEKKVDDSWKEQAAREKGAQQPRGPKQEKPQPVAPVAETSEDSPIFFNFVSGLGYQAMIHLGEIPNPSTGKSEINLDAAKEIIDLIVELKKKSKGNTGGKEKGFFDNLLPELQMRYAQKI